MSPIYRGLKLVSRIPFGGRSCQRKGLQLIPDTIDTFWYRGSIKPLAGWIQRVRCFLTLTKAAGRYGVRVLQRGVSVVYLNKNVVGLRKTTGILRGARGFTVETVVQFFGQSKGI